MTMTKMRFKDAPIGARFKFLDLILVKINSYPKGPHSDGNGCVCTWNGNNSERQNFCKWVDEDNNIDYNTEIELI